MKKSAFRHYSLNQATRKQLEVKSFGGVDYSTQKFLISNGHAIDAKNFVYRNGIVQKRHGYEQLLLVKDFYYIPADFSNPTQASVQEIHDNSHSKEINGIWRFEAEDGVEHIVAHIGKLLYEIKNIEGKDIIAEPITTGASSVSGEQHSLAFEFENYKSSAFVGGKKLWFLGGNKYMCLRYLSTGQNTERQLFAVENSDHTPIPTTTISITYTNSIVNKRSQLDNTNLLTKWRKNKLISGTTKTEDDITKTVFYEYTLDAPLICETDRDTSDILVTIEEMGEIR